VTVCPSARLDVPNLPSLRPTPATGEQIARWGWSKSDGIPRGAPPATAAGPDFADANDDVHDRPGFYRSGSSLRVLDCLSNGSKMTPMLVYTGNHAHTAYVRAYTHTLPTVTGTSS